MGNLEQEYNRIYDMLDKVSRRPGMYIGSNNLNDLVTYIYIWLSTLQPTAQTQVCLLISPAV